MEKKMFCRQCQEACRNTACTVNGMCGKKAATSGLMDKLLLQVKQIAAAKEADKTLGKFVTESLFMTVTNANFDEDRLKFQLGKADFYLDGTKGIEPSYPDHDIQSLQELLLYGVKGIAAYAHHAAVLGYEDENIYKFIFKALAATLQSDNANTLTALLLEAGHTAVTTMALLDRANTATFGTPGITTVKTGTGNRPGILVSGHDLLDLQELLEQSKDAGIDIYTHSEMLPAHYYPELRKYEHLYGNYGNAWHKQSHEFAAFNGPVLMTTNCITPVQKEYSNRIYTTGIAGYPDVPHIKDREPGKQKDFSAMILQAQSCKPPTPLENGEITGGFAHAQVFALTDRIAEAVTKGAIRRFIVMAGCDGRQSAREYYSETAAKLPDDTVILTAGCAKYRYNKLNLGTVDGIPRILDAGQCNDCYSLAVIALKLKELFKVDDINDLPISFDIAWYEQKAVAVLLALLALGFKNIRLGPTLPAFLTPTTAAILTDTFGLKGITTPDEDITNMLCGK